LSKRSRACSPGKSPRRQVKRRPVENNAISSSCRSPKPHQAENNLFSPVSALTLAAMFALPGSLLRLLVSPANLRDIALENLALRQQLAVLKRKCPRPRLRRTDRFFWVWQFRSWKDWHRTLVIVRPETVVTWHRKGFRLFWSWIFKRKSGRQEASPAIRALILKMAAANPLWGAPRSTGSCSSWVSPSRIEPCRDSSPENVDPRLKPGRRSSTTL
jgi:hypothetical protein